MAVVQLKSSDGVIFEVDEDVAAEYFAKAKANEAEGSSAPIELKVSSEILAKVVDYCEYHAGDLNMAVDRDESDAQWDEDFVDVDHSTLYGLVMAATSLEINGLLDLTTRSVANIITKMTVEEVRKAFGIKNDFTLEEEAKIKEDTPSWVSNLQEEEAQIKEDTQPSRRFNLQEEEAQIKETQPPRRFNLKDKNNIPSTTRNNPRPPLRRARSLKKHL